MCCCLKFKTEMSSSKKEQSMGCIFLLFNGKIVTHVYEGKLSQTLEGGSSYISRMP